MTRIGLYLALRPEAGGAYQYSLSMLEAVTALPKRAYHVTAVAADPAWLPILERHDLAHLSIPPSAPSSLAAYGWRKLGLPTGIWRSLAPALEPHIRRLMALKNDLWIYPAQDPMAYMLAAPALETVHDLMHRYERAFPEVSGYRMRERHYRAVCRYARGILVDSETGKRQLTESYGVDPARVHPLPYIAAAYMHAVGEPADAGTRFDLPPKFFFYPAQFWKHKNHLRLLEAASRLPHLPDLAFVFAGARKNGYDAVLARARQLGLGERVRVLDYVPNEYMPAIYRRARALVMPTFFGPTNIPPLEAMVVGCPIAISGTYGMPEQSGDAALYFDPSSVDEIAAALERLWTDDALCRQLAAAGRARAARFTQAGFNARLADIVEAVVATI